MFEHKPRIRSHSGSYIAVPLEKIPGIQTLVLFMVPYSICLESLPNAPDVHLQTTLSPFVSSLAMTGETVDGMSNILTFLCMVS